MVERSPRRPAAAERLGETVRVLERLGGEVELALARDARSCLAVCSRRVVDLIVLDDVLADEADQIFAGLQSPAPPIVVVTRGAGDDAAIDAFRRGAAECIRVGPDFAETLPVVALERIRSHRQERDRGAAERRILWLEQLNHAIVTEIPAALAVVDSRGRIVTVNPAFSRAFASFGEEPVDRPLEDVLPSELVETGDVRSLLAESLAGRPSVARIGRSGADDAALLFDVRAQRLDEEGRVLVVLSDVSERQRLTKRVADLRRYADNIIQNMNSALVVIQPDRRIAFANATAHQILACREPLAGRPVGDWFAKDVRGEPLIAKTLDEGVRFRGAEAMLDLPVGKSVPVGISCAPLSDGDGTRLGAVAIFQDLTEIKQLQRQVVQTEKMASIGQLAAGVAHEINNPMGFIHANLSQMSEYLDDLRRAWDEVDSLRDAAASGEASTLKAALEKFSQLVEELDVPFVLRDFGTAIRESQEGSERIRHIVKDLRDFSYPDASGWAAADINQCVDSTANIVWTMMKHSVVLKKEYGDLPHIACYSMQLKQVFMNLLVNAYQAIEERIGNSGDVGEIEIRTEAVRDGVVIAIRDSGAGIAAENLGRIFDPFFTTKQVGAGTGLGLSTSYSIVERHGGTLRAESVLGEGTTFEVWLPSGLAEPLAAPGDGLTDPAEQSDGT